MPYIKDDRKTPIGMGDLAHNVGELTYALTLDCITYLESAPLNYQRIAEVRGALWGTMTEIDRRVGFPYEDKKIQENGDVFPESLLG